MSLSQPLPATYEDAAPIIQRALEENAAIVTPLSSQRKRPDPPRSVIAQQGSLQALITWNAPVKFDDVTGWKVYRDNEGNLEHTINDVNTRQYSPKLTANAKMYFYISSFNGAGRESLKVQVLAISNSDQIVVTGTGGGTSGSNPNPPPDYGSEPTGGGIRNTGRQSGL